MTRQRRPAVAVILARGGSKRIPRKNVRLFHGLPLLAYPIRAAAASGIFDHVIVSTDDPAIADLAREHGAAVPFMRPAELADDHAGTDAAFAHSLREAERSLGSIDFACCLYPTPFVVADDLSRGFELLAEHTGATSAFPVVAYDFPIEQAFTLDGARVKARWPQLLDARSQDLTPHYHDAGLFYWCRTRRFLDAGRLFTDDAVAFVVAADRCQDINTPEDWHAAEWKFAHLQGRVER